MLELRVAQTRPVGLLGVTMRKSCVSEFTVGLEIPNALLDGLDEGRRVRGGPNVQRDTGLVSLQIYIRKCITNHRPQHDDESVGLGAAIYQDTAEGEW